MSQMASSADPFIGIRSIGITVGDLAATSAFYGRDLPFAEVDRFAIPASTFGPELCDTQTGQVEVVTVEVATGLLQLMRFADGPKSSTPPPVEGPGYTHICWQSPGCDPALPKLLDRGLSLVSHCDGAGVDLGGYGIRYAYGRDPEGRMIEVEILDEPPRAGPAWVAHIANVVHDHEAMLGFYTRLIGQAPHRVLRDGGGRKTHDDVAGIKGVKYHGGWFKLANLDIEVWQFLNPPTPLPLPRRKLDTIGYNAPIFEVTDLASEVARLTAMGIPLVGPQIDLGGLATRYASDPEGNLFAVQQSDPAAPGGSAARFARG
jgi:catechol 2,3-dioxygenase-like lactoylglutathione lyase family enzyme